ncbi:NtaA/DmoA family FMN-dependent monooxygenase [Nocardioides zeae]|uniref:FMN-dependent oxidoreductase (Nitrilotriacetate monooxygenase family) n=1 Tax=Nocardioides zeae TaxID=1457234 RepID=A0AAJ1U425_9ACTN|nr:NtaA/DmoA family FMN-dependent monooxygenase [Nocardioides zeae]MDQ1102777.1 FMN-dependent oxidoreductase (nitrilotriacetate monooxygenase family) [Nocardioides zeae]
MSSARPDGRHVFLAAAINGAGWSRAAARWPGTRWNRFNDVAHYREAAEIARRGVLDAVFVSDHPALSSFGLEGGPPHSLDPIPLFAALAASVPDVGFVLTASTTYNSPYNLARRLATLDAISGGRLVWNAVSSFNPDVAANFGAAPLPPRPERYRRADEFLRVVKELWLSWDAPVGPAPAGPLWDASSARVLDHHGEFFDVRGPLNVPVGPQGHPVISQAGASESGLDFAARHAEIVYASLAGAAAARAFRDDVRRRAAAHGRDPDHLRFVPGLHVVVAPTRAQAERRHEAVRGARDEEELIARFRAAHLPENDVTRHVGPDTVLDPAWFPTEEREGTATGHLKGIAELVAEEELTLRRLVRRVEGGHRLVVGTAEDVAVGILEWWEGGLADGFHLQLPILNEDLTTFVDEVVPILRAAGAVPRAYDGSTIRERLGLPDPRPVPATAG